MSRAHRHWNHLLLVVTITLAIVVGSSLAGCGSQSCTGGRRAAAHRIRNGDVVTGTSFSSVVRITIALGANSATLCTGTLIGSDLVLSAGHCVNPAALNGATVTKIQVDIPNLKEGAFVTHYKFQGGDPSSNLATTTDLSIMHLDRSLTPAPVSLASQDVAVDDDMFALGYGYDCQGTDGNGELGTLLLGRVVVNVAGDATRNIRTLAAVQPITDPESQDTCAGDSGGPLFAKNATNVLVGVLTGGNYVSVENCKNSADSFWTPVKYTKSGFIDPWVSEANANNFAGWTAL